MWVVRLAGSDVKNVYCLKCTPPTIHTAVKEKCTSGVFSPYDRAKLFNEVFFPEFGVGRVLYEYVPAIAHNYGN